MPFDLSVLRRFVRIAELGSLTRAARTLHVAQPALSQQLSALEDHLGVRLFERSHSGMTLTDAGQKLLSGATDLLARAHMLEESVSGHVGTASGVLSLGIPPAPAMTLVPPLVRRLRTKYPDLHLRIDEGRSPTLMQALLAGNLDLIVSGQLGEDGRVQSTLLAHETLYLVGGPTSELGLTVEYAELANYSLIRGALSGESRSRLDPAIQHIVADNLPAVLESNSPASTRMLVRETNLYTIMAWSTVHSEVRTGQLKAARIVNPEFHRPLYLNQPLDRRYSNLTRLVSSEIVAVVASLLEHGVWG